MSLLRNLQSSKFYNSFKMVIIQFQIYSEIKCKVHSRLSDSQLSSRSNQLYIIVFKVSSYIYMKTEITIVNSRLYSIICEKNHFFFCPLNFLLAYFWSGQHIKVSTNTNTVESLFDRHTIRLTLFIKWTRILQFSGKTLLKVISIKQTIPNADTIL